MNPRRLLATLLVFMAVTATTGANTGTGSESGARPSIVQLGDSVASGEGTRYGYRYDGTTQRWTGGDVDVAWPPPYPDCHDSPDAYGASPRDGSVRASTSSRAPARRSSTASPLHRPRTWCTEDPWAYGLSIYTVSDLTSFESRAPFHPTPHGQRAIAAVVAPVVDKLLAG